LETGGFLLAASGTGLASIVAMAGSAGITRHRLAFQVSELALDQLFGFAADRGCWVPAQFHSHAAAAFLSITDREHGLRVHGFTSAVVPDFAHPPAALAAWSWSRFADGCWIAAPCPLAADGGLEVVTFDEDGVRGY
jgi:hypothetical protein